MHTTQQVGGEDLLLKCSGRVEPAMLKVVPTSMKTLDFGPVLAGMQNSVNITLKNPGPSNAAFAIEFSVNAKDYPGLSVKAVPDRAAVPPGDSMVVTITLYSKAPAKLSALKTFMAVTLRGGPPIKMGMKADIQLPDIEVVTDEVDFGEVHVGSLERCELKVGNNSETLEAVLVVDLRKYPEFSVVFPEGMVTGLMPILPHAGAGATPVGGGGGGGGGGRGSEMTAGGGATSPGGEQLLSPEGAAGGVPCVGGTYMWFSVPPNTVKTLLIEFAPLTLKTYAFELPLLVKGIRYIVDTLKRRPLSSIRYWYVLSMSHVSYP
jgi:hypothetical protein